MGLRWRNDLDKRARGFAGREKLSWKETLFIFLSIPTRRKDLTSGRNVALIFKHAIVKRGIYFHSSNGKIINMCLQKVQS